MKKEKTVMAIIIGLVCVVLIAVMFAQFKTIEQTDITGIETAREDELRTLVSTWKTKYEEIEEKLIDTKTKINEYKEKIETNEESSELLEEELQQTNMLAGKTNVIGDGIVVTLKDNNERQIEASDLLELVNELRLAGAEAISINDKRIITTSEIVDVNVIMVNEERIVSPYTVKAIGDQKYLSSAISLKTSGFIDKYTNSGKTVSFEIEENIRIYAYDENCNKGPMELKYAQEVVEE